MSKKKRPLYLTNLCYFGAPYYDIQIFDLFEYIHRLRYHEGGVTYSRAPSGKMFATATAPSFTVNGILLETVFDPTIEVEYDIDCFAWITLDL